MRRIVSLWLPRLSTDRLARTRRSVKPAEPLALTVPERGGVRIRAVNRAAAAAGIAPGLTLADARALLPELSVRPMDGQTDERALRTLADWCTRYTPWAAPEGENGIFLDIGGSAHLFGGEAALRQDLLARLRGFGLTAGAAIAGSPGAAWAVARFGRAYGIAPIVPPGGAAKALAPLPVAALRLPADVVEGLIRVGLDSVERLCALPRAALARRFGEPVTRRLDQALGRAPEPISPRRPVPARRALLAFAEPIGRADDIAAGLERLLATLCTRLERDGLGARRLEFALYRIDGTVMRLGVGTSRPSRDADHLQRLFAEHMEKIDPGFGIEAMALAALAADSIEPEQSDLEGSDAKEPECLSMLVDRLSNRLGPAAVFRLRPCESHMPERAVVAAAALGPAARASWPRLMPRPVRLLPCPEPVEAVAEVPDGPPVLFRWRGAFHRVRRAEGPERIAPEWWRDAGAPEQATRDYYRIEDEQGRRFWLYRAGLYEAEAEPSWYLHGFFG